MRFPSLPLGGTSSLPHKRESVNTRPAERYTKQPVKHLLTTPTTSTAKQIREIMHNGSQGTVMSLGLVGSFSPLVHSAAYIRGHKGRSLYCAYGSVAAPLKVHGPFSPVLGSAFLVSVGL